MTVYLHTFSEDEWFHTRVTGGVQHYADDNYLYLNVVKRLHIIIINRVPGDPTWGCGSKIEKQ